MSTSPASLSKTLKNQNFPSNFSHLGLCSSLTTSMMSVCGTCGSQGWKRLLVTCSKCRIGCEHRYCMKEHTFHTSKDFVCADCTMRPPVQNSLASVHGSERNIVRVESSNPVPRWKTIPETSRMKLISPEEVRKLSSGGNKPTFKVPKPVPSRSPRSRSLTSTVVAKKTNPSLLSGNRQQAYNAQEGSTSKVRCGANDPVSKEISRSLLSLELLSEKFLQQLLPYRPALRTTWKGRIVDSAKRSVFSCEFLAQPASEISVKAYKLSKMIPVILKGELVPIGTLLNDLFVNRKPELTDVDMYIFPDGKNTKRFNEEHVHLFEVLKARSAMIRINISDTPLLIFSSKQLDKSSQDIIQVQKKANHFLWGIFLKKKALALVPGTSNQTT